MHTTPQLLDTLARELGGASDYRLAKVLETSSSAVSHWRSGRSHLSRPYAMKVADLLGWPAAYVIACVESEREADDGIRRVWAAIAAKFARKAAAILAAVLSGLLFTFFPNDQAVAGDSAGGAGPTTAYYVKSLLGRLRRWMGDLLIGGLTAQAVTA